MSYLLRRLSKGAPNLYFTKNAATITALIHIYDYACITHEGTYLTAIVCNGLTWARIIPPSDSSNQLAGLQYKVISFLVEKQHKGLVL